MSKNKSSVLDSIVNKMQLNRADLVNNEAQTRWLLIDSFILDFLGFSRDDVRTEYSVDSDTRVSKYDSLDYCIMLNNKPTLLVEAKSLGTNLFSFVGQLKDYYDRLYKDGNYVNSELIGILTDGDVYLFFNDEGHNGEMGLSPFYSVQLNSMGYDSCSTLLNFSKNALLVGSKVREFTSFDTEYELYVPYRIDSIETAINYFKAQGITARLDKVYLRGKLVKGIKSFKGLYRNLLKDINVLEPYLLYSLAHEENNSVLNKTVLSLVRSSKDFVEIQTKQGVVYAALSNSLSDLLYCIVFLLNKSHYGVFNVEVSLTDM